MNDPQKKHRLGTDSKDILREGLNRFHGAPTSVLNASCFYMFHVIERKKD